MRFSSHGPVRGILAPSARPPWEFPCGGLAPSLCRRYFFFAAFILLDPQEDLLLFAIFFDMHAIAVPPLRSGDEWTYRRPVRFLPASFTADFLAVDFLVADFLAARGVCGAALNSPRTSSRNLS